MVVSRQRCSHARGSGESQSRVAVAIVCNSLVLAGDPCSSLLRCEWTARCGDLMLAG